jgi:hypothetical protein
MTSTSKPSTSEPITTKPLERKKVRTHIKAGKLGGIGFFDAAHGGAGAGG